MLTGLTVRDAVAGYALSAVGERCFFCGEPLGDPAILWAGMTGELLLHGACANDLVIRLSCDIRSWQRQQARAGVGV